MENILIRYSNPTKYDLAPQKTIWKVCVDKKESYSYIQLSEVKDAPEWKLMGEFLEKAFMPFFGENQPQSEKFIQHCLDLFLSKEKPLSPVTLCNLTK